VPFVEGAVRLHYVEAGQGAPLVLLHGLGASHLDWEPQLAAFAPHRRVIAPDLRGHGQSDRPRGPYGIERWAADGWRLLDAIAPGPVALLGHSMGGAVALQMALKRPQAVTRLIISNSVPSFRPRTLGERVEVWMRQALMTLLGPQRLGEIMAQRMFPHPEHDALRQRHVARSAANDRHVYLASIRALTRWSVVKRLSRLTMPTLVLVAEHDYFPRADSEAFLAALPNGQLRFFAGARHGLPLERPDAFNAAVLEFLGAAPAVATPVLRSAAPPARAAAPAPGS
jgi:3-oxoadipate enol-lactonase